MEASRLADPCSLLSLELVLRIFSYVPWKSDVALVHSAWTKAFWLSRKMVRGSSDRFLASEHDLSSFLGLSRNCGSFQELTIDVPTPLPLERIGSERVADVHKIVVQPRKTKSPTDEPPLSALSVRHALSQCFSTFHKVRSLALLNVELPDQDDKGWSIDKETEKKLDKVSSLVLRFHNADPRPVLSLSHWNGLSIITVENQITEKQLYSLIHSLKDPRTLKKLQISLGNDQLGSPALFNQGLSILSSLEQLILELSPDQLGWVSQLPTLIRKLSLSLCESDENRNEVARVIGSTPLPFLSDLILRDICLSETVMDQWINVSLKGLCVVLDEDSADHFGWPQILQVLAIKKVDLASLSLSLPLSSCPLHFLLSQGIRSIDLTDTLPDIEEGERESETACFLSQMPNLSHLSLVLPFPRSVFQDFGEIQKFKGITEIVLHEIEDFDVAKLPASLRKFSLRSTNPIDETTLRPLTDLPSLSHLDLNFNVFSCSSDGLLGILSRLEQLVSLQLRHISFDHEPSENEDPDQSDDQARSLNLFLLKSHPTLQYVDVKGSQFFGSSPDLHFSVVADDSDEQKNVM